MKPKVRTLIAVWGKRYVDRFAALALPSLLAPGNLPALSRDTELEIVFLTAREDVPYLQAAAGFASMAALAPIRFLPIDDLIVPPYSGVTLTLAYFRGVSENGAAMVDRHFLFINSDLVLSDGSLHSVSKRIHAGESVVLANSIRSISEELEPLLKARVDPTRRVLAVAPRELVALALNALHPTQIAKIVNHDLCHSIHVNQLYWQVDETTLISRHYLMFMLCLRPQRVVESIGAFCDYAFVPEMCPASATTAMDDSDDFFALELQARESERDFLHIGRLDPVDVAKSLSRWTTWEHRDNARRHTLVFHAGPLPSDLPGHIQAAGAYVRAVEAHLEPEPQPHRGHPYWTGTLRLYEERKRTLAESELRVQTPSTAQPARRGLVGTVARILLGKKPSVRAWHPEWLDYRPVAEILHRHEQQGHRCAYVGRPDGFLKSSVPWHAAHHLDVLLKTPPHGWSAPCEFVLVEIQRSDLPNVRTIIELLRQMVTPQGEIAVFLHEPSHLSDYSELQQALAHNVERIAPADLSRMTVSFAGGAEKRAISRMLHRLNALRAGWGIVLLPVVALGALVALACAAVNNMQHRRLPAGTAPSTDCSSVLVVVGPYNRDKAAADNCSRRSA